MLNVEQLKYSVNRMPVERVADAVLELRLEGLVTDDRYADDCHFMGGRRLATCSALKPPQEMPIMPTVPLHQGCWLSHSITSIASSCSCRRYSPPLTPSAPWKWPARRSSPASGPAWLRPSAKPQ